MRYSELVIVSYTNILTKHPSFGREFIYILYVYIGESEDRNSLANAFTPSIFSLGILS